jgi:TolB-like protein
LAGVHYSLELLGPFRLLGPDGQRIDVSSKKAQALIAMLAVSGGGERTRSWLRGQLWGSRGQDQALASLRSELSNLRAALHIDGSRAIQSDKNRVWLDLSRFKIDVREGMGGDPDKGEFLEGLDIPGEEGFEDWLREERTRFATRQRAHNPDNALTLKVPPNDFAHLPALAILPFVNLTGDPAQDILAEGISEDLIDRLSRLRWLPIIARGSSFAFRKTDQDPRAAGKALGARYVLEGRLRHVAGQQVLNMALVSSQNGQQLWSSKFVLTSDGTFEVLDDLLTGLASTLGTRIDQEEQARALRKPQSDLNVRDLIWRGRWHLNRMTKEDGAIAKACFAQALAIEPNSPEAIIQSTWARAWELWAQRGSLADITELRQMAQKAIIADYDDARGHMLAGIAEIWLHQPFRAEALLRRALELSPSLVMAYVQLGASFRVLDKHEQAIEAFNSAIRLSPNDQDIFFTYAELAASHLMLGHFDEALHFSDQALSRRRAYWFAHVIKVNALVRSGRAKDAHAALEELHAIKPNFRAEFIDWSPFTDPRNSDFLKDGLNQVERQND